MSSSEFLADLADIVTRRADLKMGQAANCRERRVSRALCVQLDDDAAFCERLATRCRVKAELLVDEQSTIKQ